MSGDAFVQPARLMGERNGPTLHSTSAPKMVKEKHSVKEIETLLQDKLVQHTSRDSDKFRQILRLFQQQARNRDEEPDGEPSNVVGISEENFENVLALLDVWATRAQAKVLFEKYDMNGDGMLTAHEFVTRCRPVDIDTSVDTWNREPKRMPTGKRIYDHSGGTPSIPPTPTSSRFTVNKMARDLREKFKQQYPTRMSMNSSRSKLNTFFQYYDRSRSGVVDEYEMRRVLDAVNFNIGDENIGSLVKKFSMDGQFDYRRFSAFVFPQAVDGTLSTSLEIGQAFYERRSRESSMSGTTNSWNRTQSHASFGRGAQTARPYRSSQSDAQLKAYAMQRPGMVMPNTARAQRNGQLPQMDGPSRPGTASGNRQENTPFLMHTNRPATGSGMRPATGSGMRPATGSGMRPSSRLQNKIPIPPPPRPNTARHNSAGNLRPGTANKQQRQSFQGNNNSFRPPSSHGFNDVSPIPGQQQELDNAPAQAPAAWSRPARPKTPNPIRPQTSRPPTRSRSRPATGHATRTSRAPSRAPSRAGRAQGVMQNPLTASSPYFPPQPINQDLSRFGVGIPSVNNTAVKTRLRKVKKKRGKKSSQARLGTYGRPRPPPMRLSHPYLERPSFSVF